MPAKKTSKNSKAAKSDGGEKAILGTEHPNFLLLADFAPEVRSGANVTWRVRLETDLIVTDIEETKAALADLTSKPGKAKAAKHLKNLVGGMRAATIKRMIDAALDQP